MSTTPFDRAVDAATAGVNRTLGTPSWQQSAMRMVQPRFGQSMAGLRGMPADQSQKFRGSFQTPIESRFGDTTRSIANRFPEFFGALDATSDAQDKLLGMQGMQSGYSGYGGASTGDTAIDQAAAKNGLPPAVLASFVNRESSGNWEANQTPNCTIRPESGCLLPYVGIFETTARSWGIDFNSLIGNQQAQLDAMAKIINGIKQQQGFTNWEDVAAYYFAGPNWNNPDWADENGLTVAQYREGFTTYVNQYGGGYGNLTQDQFRQKATDWNTSVGGELSVLWGRTYAPVTYDFGVESGLGYYGYGALSGLDGTQHTGLDVGVPRGTNLYSPGSGVVSCVGYGDAGIGGTGGGGCGFYEDSNGGIGNITIRLDNGTYVILGHSQLANVQPGQRVSAGQLVGQSGGMNGDHVHVETRVPDATTQSGYRIVDPRTVLGGYTGVSGYTPAYGSANQSDPRYGGVGNYMQSYYGGWRPSY
jgi:murein DD-endopeptidase MepM/ murein hydrolase activator NlpD